MSRKPCKTRVLRDTKRGPAFIRQYSDRGLLARHTDEPYLGSQGQAPGSWADDEFEDDMDILIELFKPTKYNGVRSGPDGKYYPVGPQNRWKIDEPRRRKRKKKK